MMTACLKSYRSRARLALRAGIALAVGAVASGLAGSPTAAAQNLVQNGTFAITGGSTSFDFGGYYAYGGPSKESLACWTYIPSNTGSNSGAAFDFVSGQTNAYYYGNLTQVLPSAITAPVGGNFAAIDSNWGQYTLTTPGISQTSSGLTVGSSYTLSFSYALTQWYGYLGSDSAVFQAIKVDPIRWTGTGVT